ncbi:MAG: TRAP transporter small permease subunit [Parvularculaceae bacterium]|nr:TRAP transporter small permease subunit [Parvularculaceae bacterium]
MTTGIGDILNWLAAGALFPAMLLPLAGLVRGKLYSALALVALLSAIVAASVVFAHLAVDLNPPRLSAGFLMTSAIAVTTLFIASASTGARGVVARLTPFVEALVRGAGRLTLFLVLAMASIQFAAVMLRYVFGLNFIAMQESVTYLHGAVFLLAGGYALLTDDHVRVDIFYREASPRRKALVDLAGTYLFLVPFCLVALWAAAPYVANSWAVREGSVEQSGIKGVYLLKTLIPTYLTLLLLAGFAAAARAAETLRPSNG